MTDRETAALLDQLAGEVPVGPAPTAQLLRAGRRARRRRTAGAALAVATGAAVIAGGVTVLEVAPWSDVEPRPMVVAEDPGTGAPEFPGPGEDPGPAAGSSLSPLPPDPTADRTGPLAGNAAAGCVEEYAPAAVRERDFAFDGVVTAIGPSVTGRSGTPGPELAGVTFAVQEWFSGGTGGTVTVDMPAPGGPGQGSTSEQGPAYGLGSRLLVSGEARWDGAPLADPIAWTCGFTRYHDEDTAAAWR